MRRATFVVVIFKSMGCKTFDLDQTRKEVNIVKTENCWKRRKGWLDVVNIIQFYSCCLWYTTVCLFFLLNFSKNSLLVTADEFEVQLQQYKNLSVLEVYINSCFRQIFLPSAFVLISVANVFGMLLTVSLFHHEKYSNAPKLQGLGKALFPLLVVQGYVATLALGSVAGRLNKASKLFLGTLKQGHFKTGQKAHRIVCIWRSCAPIKIRFANNFVATSTPLALISFCLKVTVRLLLIL